MVKTLFILFLFPFLQVTAESYKSPAPDTYYNIIQQDTFYYLLSNNNVKLLSNGNSSTFILWDSIPGQFSSSTLIAVNNNYLLLKNNDSISLYKKDLVNGKLYFKNKCKDSLNQTLFFPFNNDFVAVTGSIMNMLGCNDDSSFIKAANFATYTGQSIDYPYFVYYSSIYKYVDGFGYYQVFEFSDYINSSITYKGSIIYHTYYAPNPSLPPHDIYLKKSLLREPDFVTYYTSINYWGSNEPYTVNSPLLAATDKYLNFVALIYTYEPVFVLYTYSYSEKIFITDKYIFKLGSDIEVSTSTSSPAVFSPLTYRILTGLNESVENIPIFSLYQNFPNPFNSETKIGFTLSEKGSIKLIIYNILGKVVKNLISKEMEKGIHIINFQSEGLSSGIYLYSLISGGNIITKKMLILK